VGALVIRETMRRQFDAVRVVFTTGPLRDCQIAIALVRTTDLAQLVAVSAFLFEHGGLSSVAAYGVVRTVAPGVGAPVVSTATARVGHGRLLRLLALIAAVGSAGITAALIVHGPSAVVLVLAAVAGFALGPFRPISSALMPSLVSRPEELVACTAAAGFLDGATTVAGPLLAGVLLGVAGAAWAVGATVVLLVAAALFAGRLPAVRTLNLESTTKASDNALRALFASPESATIAILAPCQTFVRGALNVIVVVFVVDALDLNDGAIGVLLAAIGVGGMIGLPAALGIVGTRRMYRSFGLGLALWGLPLAITAGVPQLAAAVVLFAIVGVGNVLVDVSTYSALPRAVPDRVLAKVFGLLEALLQIGMALGAVVAGVLLHAFSARITLLVVVCCCRSSRSPQLRCFAASMPDSHTTIWKLTCCDASRCSKTCQCLFSTTSAHASFPPISAPAT
jgi:MFS family permease